MRLKVFGQLPRGTDMARILHSTNYHEGQFHNQEPTVLMKDGFKLRDFWNFFTARNTRPPRPLPTVKRDLNNPQPGETELTWFGHSSYLIQHEGLNILVDPVFSGHASPFPVAGKAFAGADAYTVADMPPIDLLIITHDHYDHMDYATITALQPKVKLICTSLGIAAHLRHWGIPEKKVLEFDWWETQQAHPAIALTAVPARHFSGRSLRRNGTLWSAFVLELTGKRIFLGGDSGYGRHFAEIGRRFGPFDLALLECGQYNERWPMIHMMPEENVQAAIDLQAKVLMPVHWGKFALALHTWDEPINRLVTSAKERDMAIVTPKIGERVLIGTHHPQEAWWLTV
ncbi:MBL fold metallo-hydrolase [Chitinophaga horti]|uniref:MBL fold metallo-hydrolase n=1 Tax=Chitinophaga horti TaxID=2920382 RepID=A0ABY6J4Q7_9BACT|nr:MBL fold metallo-hydrolase [Chitinophaga horti]UYQ94588.1 MBL fold metallo-hydrolase [Chitinophaga horti]